MSLHLPYLLHQAKSKPTDVTRSKQGRLLFVKMLAARVSPMIGSSVVALDRNISR